MTHYFISIIIVPRVCPSSECRIDAYAHRDSERSSAPRKILLYILVSEDEYRNGNSSCFRKSQDAGEQ